MTDFAALRARMVDRQLRRRGIGDERVLEALGEVPREAFVPPRHARHAYADSALPIGSEQTISQPWIVAAICQALELQGDEGVLEIGTGSGYSACVLASLAAEVLSVERHEALALAARETLASLGVDNVEVLVGTAASASPPRSVRGDRDPCRRTGRTGGPDRPARRGRAHGAADRRSRIDTLTVLRRSGEKIEAASLGPCRFVPLIGEAGF